MPSPNLGGLTDAPRHLSVVRNESSWHSCGNVPEPSKTADVHSRFRKDRTLNLSLGASGNGVDRASVLTWNLPRIHVRTIW